MTHDVKNNERAGRFEIELDGDTAYAEYELKGDGGIAFPHTVVPSAFEGRGVGSALVKGGWPMPESTTSRLSLSAAFSPPTSPATPSIESRCIRNIGTG